MIELYTWTTPNGFKPLVMLEELELPYRVTPVDLGKGEQSEPSYLELNPNGRIPALVDHDAPGGPVRLFESGAILVYLAEKTGRFLPKEGQARADTFAWLMFQMSAVGPMFGQWGHFRSAKRQDSYALERYANESKRIVGVLGRGLAKRTYLAGEYSIADIATYPWVSALPTYYGYALEAEAPEVAAWVARVGERPAVKKAMAWKPGHP